MHELVQQILDNPGASLAIIGNLIIIESLLSVDNAAVLATMVMDLPEKDRNKALKYGIWGAYIFRGLAMIFASVLLKFWFLKPLGGLYLLYLVYGYWKGKQTETEEDDFRFKVSKFFNESFNPLIENRKIETCKALNLTSEQLYAKIKNVALH